MTYEPTEAEIEEALADEEQRYADYWDGGSQYWDDWHARHGSPDEELDAGYRFPVDPDGAFIHIVGYWQGLLDRLRIKVPRALCGASLTTEPGEYAPGQDLLTCPKCLWRSDIGLASRFRNRWRTCGWCGGPADTGKLCRQCRNEGVAEGQLPEGSP